MAGFLRHLELRRSDVLDWNRYPYSIPAVASLERLPFSDSVTFLIGENGCGKSTFVEAIAIKAGFNPEGGTKHFSTALRPSESSLHEHLLLVRGSRRERTGFFLRAETMFNISTEAEQYAVYGWERLHDKSHGEAFLWVAFHRFGANGLYILDEPEAALSPQRQLSLLARIQSLVLEGSQFVIATHSPILMAYPGATLLQLDEEGIAPIEYRDTAHYSLTRSFLERPERMLKELLRDE